MRAENETPWWMMDRDPNAMTAREAMEAAREEWRRGRLSAPALMHICSVGADTEALSNLARDMAAAAVARRKGIPREAFPQVTQSVASAFLTQMGRERTDSKKLACTCGFYGRHQGFRSCVPTSLWRGCGEAYAAIDNDKVVGLIYLDDRKETLTPFCKEMEPGYTWEQFAAETGRTRQTRRALSLLRAHNHQKFDAHRAMVYETLSKLGTVIRGYACGLELFFERTAVVVKREVR